jgi:hypothetical protein
MMDQYNASDMPQPQPHQTFKDGKSKKENFQTSITE